MYNIHVNLNSEINLLTASEGPKVFLCIAYYTPNSSGDLVYDSAYVRDENLDGAKIDFARYLFNTCDMSDSGPFGEIEDHTEIFEFIRVFEIGTIIS